MRRIALPFALGWTVMLAAPGLAADEPRFSRTEDVIYGRKHGTALTMDVFRPSRDANGAAVIWVVSGGWTSSHEAVSPAFARPLVERGYTVFAVVHGSKPRYTVPEIVPDIHRAVRFIRHHAGDYAIDPGRIGIAGASAGGHLALMLATAGDQGDPAAKDPVDREPSRVQAVACFFPPPTSSTTAGPAGRSSPSRTTPRRTAPPSTTGSSTRRACSGCRSPTRPASARSPATSHQSPTSRPTTRRR